MNKLLGRLLFALTFFVLLLILFLIPINPNSSSPTRNLTHLVYTLITGKNPLESKKQTTVYLLGDILLGRTVMTTSLDKNNLSYPFDKTKDELAKADLVIANLENPFVSGCKRDYDSTTFCADPKLVEGLVTANIDVVNLANNHTKNYGEDGLKETIAVLESHNITPTGLDKLVTKDINNIKFGILGFNLVNSGLSEDDLRLVHSSSTQVDVLIIEAHWGNEYTSEPSDNQKQMAQKLIENGATVVVGSHPHWVQTIDHINGHPVYYSLGNFVFDQMWSQKTREGLVMKLTFEGKDLAKEEILKTLMQNWAQPEFVKN
jgi:poly-gamma-glutamate capsule biosynthesis protein CapA/YwtB (metallophosphatase superfamily)